MKKFSIDGEPPNLSLQDIARYKDTPWTLLFITQFLVVLAFMFSFGLKALSSTPPEEVELEENGDKNKESYDDLSIELIGGLLLIIGMGGLLSIAWVQVTATMASKIVMFSLVTVILVNVFSGIALFAFDQLVPAIMLLLFAAASLLFFLYVRDRLEFVAANLKVGCRAVLAMPAVILWALVVLLLQIVWCVVWFIAAYGVATNESVTSIHKGGHTYNLASCTTYTYYDDVDIAGLSLQCAHSSCSLCLCDHTVVRYGTCFAPRINYWKYFALFLSLYWTSAVLSNIVHCTTAGAVSSWWFNGTPLTSSRSTAIVKSSAIHASTALLGPICFGSLLVAVIRASRSMLHIWIKLMKPQSGGGSSLCGPTGSRLMEFAVSCLETALRVLDQIVTYCNHYAFCYVSIYDMGFVEASSAVVNLFLTKGFATLINDNLLDNVLTMGHLVVGVLCLLVGYGYAVVVGLGQDSSYTILLAMSGFFIGYSMCMLTLNVISSATATVYVCFAENPSTLQTHHPEYFEELMSKWRKFYPEASISIGTVDGQEYAPPAAPAWGSGGVRSSSGGSRGTGLGASSRSGGVSQTGGYFALATSLHDDDTAFAYEGDEEEAEVSLSLNDPPFAADRDVLCDSGEGILQGDVLTGSEKDNGHRSFEV